MDVRSVLIVEDDAALAGTLRRALALRAKEVRIAGTLAEARAVIDPVPDVVVLDFALPDGTADALLHDLIEEHPMPTVIAMSGVASTEESFLFAQCGVRAFLQKPFDLNALARAWEHALTDAPDFAPTIRQAVGKLPLRAVEQVVRCAMIDEALSIASGSRRRAAGLLEISRQALQHIIKALPDDVSRRWRTEDASRA